MYQNHNIHKAHARNGRINFRDTAQACWMVFLPQLSYQRLKSALFRSSRRSNHGSVACHQKQHCQFVSCYPSGPFLSTVVLFRC